MSSVSQGDGFIEVTRGSKKRKASTSHTLPVITSGVNEKFKPCRKLTSELRQYHSSLKISTIKELPKGGFL